MKGQLYVLENVVHHYGNSYSLRIPRLAIPAGLIFCVLGPTGAGKSTLLRLLAAIESPTEGRVVFEGEELSGFTDALPISLRRKMTMVFQKPILLNASVRANVEYGLRLRGIRPDPQRVEAILQRLRLSSIADQPARTLSGGQTQLVALARALVLDVDVLLLDEPTANLDPARVSIVEETLREIRMERNLTIVLATHNLFQARRLADEVVLLLDGEVVEHAPVDRFFESPRDPRTKAFLEGKIAY